MWLQSTHLYNGVNSTALCHGRMGRCFVRAQTRASYFINVSCYCCCSWETRGQHQALDHVLQAQELLEAPWAPYLSLRPAVLKLNAWG